MISIFFYYGYLPTVFKKQIDAEFIRGSFPPMDPVFSQHQKVAILKTQISASERKVPIMARKLECGVLPELSG